MADVERERLSVFQEVLLAFRMSILIPLQPAAFELQ